MSALPRNPVRLAAIAALACLAAGAGASGAQPGRSDLWEGNRALAKVSSHLLRARALAADGRSATGIAAAVPALQLRDGLPEVEVSLERLTPELVEQLRARGLEVDGFHLGYARVHGRLDPANLDEIAALTEVSTIYPKPVRGTRTGSVANQADVTMNSDDVRATLGADGSGVIVGILSDSFNKTGLGGTTSGGFCTCEVPGSSCATVVTGMDNQTSGDLPTSIPILDDCTVGGSSCSGLTDEGAAIGELIFDVAPMSGFMFHSAFNSDTDFAEGITQLVNCGADLIVDDVFYTRQPFFQDGVIAQAAQAAVDAGVPYFSAAGNDGTFGVDDVYLDSDPADNTNPPPVDGKDFHDFGGDDTYAAITLPAGCRIHLELQWSEPFDGMLGDGASSDLDLYLLDSENDPASQFGLNVVDSSITKQGCGIPAVSGGDPVEIIQYTNEEAGPETVFLAIDHFCGNEGVEMRIVTLSFDCSPTFEDGGAGGGTPIFVDAQIFGHPAAKDVLAVGAAFYGEIDSEGALDPPPGQLDVEFYSSKGGNLPFYFDGNGDPLPTAAPPGAESVVRDDPPPPEFRFKPDITSVDGTNTTFFGSDIGFDADAFPNFFGTSAAAPHATALAVLIWQLTGELISPRALHQLIEQAVLDMEIPDPDALSGHGFADALRAALSVDDTSAPLTESLEFDLDGESFLTSVSVSPQPLQALDTLIVGDGKYDSVHGTASTIIFADGFESGDVSVWGN